MPGDESGKNEEELLSQIDDLRERMDRLMKGGTSTSNSALLTDSHRQTVRTVKPEPAPERRPVRDLIGPADREVVESYTGAQDAVAFPESDATDSDGGEAATETVRPHADRPPSAATPLKPDVSGVDGSLISVPPGGRNEGRRPVSSFDDIGSAVEEELARDASVPPAEPKKGPGLASRFGAVDEPVRVAAESAPDVGERHRHDVDGEFAEARGDGSVPAEPRNLGGAVVAIWAFTGVTGGTIAVLHLAGVI